MGYGPKKINKKRTLKASLTIQHTLDVEDWGYMEVPSHLFSIISPFPILLSAIKLAGLMLTDIREKLPKNRLFKWRDVI